MPKRLFFISFDRRTFWSLSTHFESTWSNLNLFVLSTVSQKVNQFWSFFNLATGNVSFFLSKIIGRSIPTGTLRSLFSHKTSTENLVNDKRVFYSAKATLFLLSKRLILFYVYSQQSSSSCYLAIVLTRALDDRKKWFSIFNASVSSLFANLIPKRCWWMQLKQSYIW